MQAYKYLGIVSIFLAWLAVGLVLYKWPVATSKSISKHIASQRESYLLNLIITTTSLLLFYVFAIKWLVPVYAMPTAAKIVLILGIVLEIITAWVPDSKGWRHWTHNYAAYTAALLLPIFTWFLISSPASSELTRLVAILSTAVMVVTISLFAFIKSTKSQHLIYQSVYLASFHVAILAAIFTVSS